VLPRPDRTIGTTQQRLLGALPALQGLLRLLVYVHYESRALWYVHLPRMLGAAQWIARRHLHKQVADPALRAKLTPDYALGCKRVLLMNTYYPALARPNVEVVTEAIAQVRAHSIVTASGQEREVDAIVFGTGFDVEHTLAAPQVRGRGGRQLFVDDKEGYKGCAVAGFPNYFTITGPNTGLGHNSMIYMIESGVAYVLEAIRAIRAGKLHSVEVKQEVQRAYNADLQRRMKRTVWSTGCKSWYLDKDGKNFSLWPGFTFSYRRMTRRFDIENYVVKQSRD
jgi:cation diffusion facilitator CzcD-associated flavoprotein CzcO